MVRPPAQFVGEQMGYSTSGTVVSGMVEANADTVAAGCHQTARTASSAR